jgi:hypothetical protein
MANFKQEEHNGCEHYIVINYDCLSPQTEHFSRFFVFAGLNILE